MSRRSRARWATAIRRSRPCVYKKPFNQIGTADDFYYFPTAFPYHLSGNDVIDASLAFSALPASGLGSTSTGTTGVTVGVTAYGGPGDDVIYGSQAGDFLAGGSGDDLIVGGRGIDQIYGDSGINVDVLSRNLDIPTAPGVTSPVRDDLTAGRDTLHGDFPGVGVVLGYTPAPAYVDPGSGPDSAYKDIIFGDHGIVRQDIPYLRADLIAPPLFVRLLTTLRDFQLQTTNPQNGAPDIITGDLATDRIFGGQGGDTILGNEGDDLILGDQGYISYRLPAPDSGVEMPDVVTTCMDPNLNVCAQNTGGNDVIDGNDGQRHRLRRDGERHHLRQRRQRPDLRRPRRSRRHRAARRRELPVRRPPRADRHAAAAGALRRPPERPAPVRLDVDQHDAPRTAARPT